MLRQLLIARGISLSDNDFTDVMDLVTDDIKANNILLGKRTSTSEMIEIAVRSAIVLKRCA